MHFARVKLEYSKRGSPKQVPEKSKDIGLFINHVSVRFFRGEGHGVEEEQNNVLLGHLWASFLRLSRLNSNFESAVYSLHDSSQGASNLSFKSQGWG